MKVFVIEHMHRHGTSTAVCATRERAEMWVTQTVSDEWEGEMGSTAPTTITDEHITEYCAKTGENFEIDSVEVLE